MDDKKSRLGVCAFLILLGLGILLWYWKETRPRSLLQAVQEENASLRVELTAKDATITDLRVRVERLESTFPSPNSVSAPFNIENSELGRRLAELTILQSNTLALVEKLVPLFGQSESPDEIQRRRNNGIRMLESELVEQQRKVESAKQKLAELQAALRVPDDVAALESHKALNMPSLETYWPYFEARRERDSERLLAEILRMKLTQEKSER